MADEAGRRLRADARLNEDRVLDAASRAFARDGVDASLKAIAQDAGVGIGTLYRRFPTRERLVWAVYSSEVDRICAYATELLETREPVAALRAWMDEFLAFLATKRGMAEALRAALANDEGLRLGTRHKIVGALGTLLRAGAAAGTIRSDVDPLDVMMALGGTALIAGEPDQGDQATRLVDLLMDAVLRRVPPRAG